MAAVVLQTPVARARQEKGFSLRQLAALVGTNSGGLSRIEQGIYRPRKQLAIRLAQALDLTRDQVQFPEEYQEGARKPVQSARPEVQP